MGGTCKSIRKEFAKMSEQYTSQLKNEINLYLNNLEMYKNFNYENVQSICRQETEFFQEVLEREVIIARKTLDEIMTKPDRTQVDILKVFEEILHKLSAEIYSEMSDRLNSNATIKKANRLNRMLGVEEETGYGLMNYSHLYQVITLCPSSIGLRVSVRLEDTFSENCKSTHEEFTMRFCKLDMDKCKAQKDHMYQFIAWILELDFDLSPLESLIEEYLNDERMTGLKEENVGGTESVADELLSEAWQFIREQQKASIGILQRHFKIGFNRAARLLDALEDIGYVGEDQGTKSRKILSNAEELPSRTDSVSDVPHFVPGVSKIKEQCEELKDKFTSIIAGFPYRVYVDLFLKEEFLVNLRKQLEEMPQADLPDIIQILREEELYSNADMADVFVRFRNQYRETAEQVMSSNQAYYAQKQMEQAEAAAEEQRILMQRQMEEVSRQTQMIQEEEERRTKQMLSEEERRTKSIVASMERQNKNNQQSITEDSNSYRPKNGASHPFSWKHDKEYVFGVGYRDKFGNYYNHNGMPIPPPSNK